MAEVSGWSPRFITPYTVLLYIDRPITEFRTSGEWNFRYSACRHCPLLFSGDGGSLGTSKSQIQDVCAIFRVIFDEFRLIGVVRKKRLAPYMVGNRRFRLAQVI